MPPPGIPEWIFPGAVVYRGPYEVGTQLYVIAEVQRGMTEVDGLVAVDALSRADTRYLDPSFIGEAMSLRAFVSEWHHMGAYAYPTEPPDPGIPHFMDTSGEPIQFQSLHAPQSERERQEQLRANIRNQAPGSETAENIEVRLNDQWLLSHPYNTIWFVQSVNHTYSGGMSTITCLFQREEPGIGVQTISYAHEWVLANGYRVSPPDPRIQQPIRAEVGQIWAIPTFHTQQEFFRWHVTGVRDVMVTLTPDGSGGEPLTWHQVRLQVQGRFISDGRPRRTSFERLLDEDETGDVGGT